MRPVVEWSEPVLLRYDFEVSSTSLPAIVYLGFPQRVEDRGWTCAFQFQAIGDHEDRLSDGDFHRVRGDNGLEALIAASNAIRSRLERLTDARSGLPYEFIFPGFLPTSWSISLYDWAKELVESETDRNSKASRPAFPLVEQLSRTTWDEPTLLEQQFKFGAGRKVSVRLGFPTFSQGLKSWTCAFQLRGAAGNQIKKVSGDNGLLAVANAADLIRTSLDQIGVSPAGNDSHELTFPVHVPTERGLEIHRQLSKRISTEIKAMEQKDGEKQHKRAIAFNEILADLPPSARL